MTIVHRTQEPAEPVLPVAINFIDSDGASKVPWRTGCDRALMGGLEIPALQDRGQLQLIRRDARRRPDVRATGPRSRRWVPAGLFRPSRSMTRYQYMSLMAETDRQQPGWDPMRRQQQRIRQFLDRSGHVAGDETGAGPVGGAVGPHSFRSRTPGSLRNFRPKPCRR